MCKYLFIIIMGSEIGELLGVFNIDIRLFILFVLPFIAIVVFRVVVILVIVTSSSTSLVLFIISVVVFISIFIIISIGVVVHVIVVAVVVVSIIVVVTSLSRFITIVILILEVRVKHRYHHGGNESTRSNGDNTFETSRGFIENFVISRLIIVEFSHLNFDFLV